ncbi:MAG: DJ-1/PfpI family protein [Gammaproteobacteria bacterium]|nr:DJ-1/PfpI family protein [Gammaproteobacteria bacterium]
MNTVVLAYDGCILFEVLQAAAMVHERLPVRVATPDGAAVTDRSGIRVLADDSYDSMVTADVGCLLIPGGNPDSIAGNTGAMQIVRDVVANGGVVAGICAGVAVLGLAGVLQGRRVAHNYTDADVPPEVRRHTDPLWQGTVFEPSGIAVDGAVISARPERHEAFGEAVALACRTKR